MAAAEGDREQFAGSRRLEPHMSRSAKRRCHQGRGCSCSLSHRSASLASSLTIGLGIGDSEHHQLFVVALRESAEGVPMRLSKQFPVIASLVLAHEANREPAQHVRTGLCGHLLPEVAEAPAPVCGGVHQSSQRLRRAHRSLLVLTAAASNGRSLAHVNSWERASPTCGCSLNHREPRSVVVEPALGRRGPRERPDVRSR